MILRDILKCETREQFEALALQYMDEVFSLFAPLEAMLDRNILSQDVSSIELHMSAVESWRNRVARQLAFATAGLEIAKSSRYLPAPAKGVTESIREGIKRELAAPWSAVCLYLSELIRSVDSRVNLCKKQLGVEFEGVRLAPSGRAA